MKHRVAIVHDWLITIGGAEKVLRQLLIAYPEADLFCLFNFFNKEQQKEILLDRPTHGTYLQSVPFSKSQYRKLVPLFYKAIESLDVSEYDIVISSSHAVAKGVKIREGQLHFCYCHTPMRYVWNMKKTYLSQIPERFRKLASRQFKRIKDWDYQTSDSVHQFIANSEFVKERIKVNYQKDSLVINPPVDTEFFKLAETMDSPEDQPYYIVVSRLVFYKRIDVTIEAFNLMPNKNLIVIGSGPERENLEKMANPNIRFLDFQSSENIRRYMQHAEAAIFSAIEDFGITCLEVQACGTPVVAYDFGGYRETVNHGSTGVLYKHSDPESIIEAVSDLSLMKAKMDRKAIRRSSLKYGEQRFRDEITSLVSSRVNANEQVSDPSDS